MTLQLYTDSDLISDDEINCRLFEGQPCVIGVYTDEPYSRCSIRIGEGVTLRTRADIVVIGVGMTPVKVMRISYVGKARLSGQRPYLLRT